MYAWHKTARFEGRLLPHVADKFSTVVETAAMDQTQLSAWYWNAACTRNKCVSWRRACVQANDLDRQHAERLKTERKAERGGSMRWNASS